MVVNHHTIGENPTKISIFFIFIANDNYTTTPPPPPPFSINIKLIILKRKLVRKLLRPIDKAMGYFYYQLKDVNGQTRTLLIQQEQTCETIKKSLKYQH